MAIRFSRRVLQALVRATGACAIVAAAGPASAQFPDIEFAPKASTPGFVFTPRITFGAEFDDNVVIAAEGNPTADDILFRANPGLDLTYTKKHTVFEAGYSGTFQRYRTLDVYDSYDQLARVELRHQPSRRVQLSFRNGFSVNPSTDVVGDATVPFLRTGTRQDTLDAGAQVAVSRRMDLIGSYKFQWLDFDQTSTNADLLLQGGRAHTVTFGMRQRVREHVAVGADYSVQHAVVLGGTGTSDIQNAEAVVTWQASETVHVEGGIGLSHVSLGDGLGSQTAPAGHVSVSKRTEYVMFNLGASRSYRPSFGAGRSTQNLQVTGGAYVPFARRAYVQGQLMWHRNEPVLADALQLSAFWFHAETGYAFSRWLRAEAFYRGALQDTNVAGGRVRRNRIGVRIVTSAPMRID